MFDWVEVVKSNLFYYASEYGTTCRWISLAIFVLLLTVLRKQTIENMKESKVQTAMMFVLYIASLVTVLWS